MPSTRNVTRAVRRAALACLIVGAALSAHPFERVVAQQGSPPESALEVIHVRADLYMIAGAGSNITVQTGRDGAIVVDTGSGDRSEQVIAAIRNLTPNPIRYIINTGADRDHVGGNDALSQAGRSIIPTGGLNEIGAAGGRAPILAEEHVQARMTAPTGEVSPFPVGAWPTVTYSSELQETRKDLYFNGQAIQVFYQPAAHSDGDSIVFFRGSDAIATGDVFDMTRFPVIDIENGGTVQGIIDSLNRIIAIAVAPVPLIWQEGGTVILPGHGRVAYEADVVDYRDMVTIIRDRIQDSMAKGLTLDQIQKADPTQGYRRRFGSDSGAWTTNQFVEAVYNSLNDKK